MHKFEHFVQLAHCDILSAMFGQVYDSYFYGTAVLASEPLTSTPVSFSDKI